MRGHRLRSASEEGEKQRWDPGRSQWMSEKGESNPDGLAVAEGVVGVDERKDKGCTRDGGYRRGSHHIPGQRK